MTVAKPRIILTCAAIIGISLLHYLTPLHLPQLHDVFQRLYYIPIILCAFWFGMRGGLAASLLVSLLYIPHVLFQWGMHPALDLEKYLEILLYNVVGGITGFLSQREDERRRELEVTARGLEESYQQLQHQAELILDIEEQLRQKERLSALGEVSAVLAHEIRNPLGSIRGAAEILRDDYPPHSRKHEFLQIMIKESERLNRVVESFLGLTRPLDVAAERFSLRDELHEVQLLVGRESSSHGVGLTVSMIDDPVLVADRDRLRQALLNILLNAIQATPAGGTVAVSASIVREPGRPDHVQIVCRDSGQGMTSEEISAAFRPFVTTRKGGTGLGLPITEKIIKAHGGTIAIESEPGKGTSVVIRIPVNGRQVNAELLEERGK